MPSMQNTLHIRLLELVAVRFALASFPGILKGKKVLIQMDNTAVVYYFNKQGGSSSLGKSCGRRHLRVIRITRLSNTKGDRLGRV